MAGIVDAGGAAGGGVPALGVRRSPSAALVEQAEVLALHNLFHMLAHVVMPTSIHLPKPLLAAVDRRARALRVSRNRWIVRALQRELGNGGEWSPGFFDRLAETDAETTAAVDDLLAAIRARRTRKTPPRL